MMARMHVRSAVFYSRDNKMVLTEILINNAQQYPQKRALTMHMGYRTITLTYAQVYELAQKLAVLLERNNINKGDPVIIVASNSPYWIALFWACLLRGAVIVPLNVQSTGAMIDHVIKQTGARIAFTSIFCANKLPPEITQYVIDLAPDVINGIKVCEYQPVVVHPDDLVQIMYTSGTTGAPKGVMHTHRNLWTNLAAISELFPEKQDDRFLSILPLSHIFEQAAGFLAPYSRQAEIIYAHSPTKILPLMQQYKITKLIAVPEFLHIVMSRIRGQADKEGKLAQFERALTWAEKINKPWVSRLLFRKIHRFLGGHLDTVASGGAPLSIELENEWRALGIHVLRGYGLTETSPLVSSTTYTQDKPGSVGKVVKDVQVTISPEKEILVKGPNVTQGYFKNPEKTAESFTADGWFKTGDLGELDHDGFLFIRGRKKYMILSPGGQNVYPEDIEDALNAIPGVREACVVGLDHSDALVAIHASLLLDDEALVKAQNAQTGQQFVANLIKQANEHLASYQQITDWSLWPDQDFPRTVTRKVKKNDVIDYLRHRAQTQSAQASHEPQHISQLKRIIGQITDTDPATIQAHDTLTGSLKLDSLMRVELVARIEDTYTVTVAEGDITPQTTVADLEHIIKEKKPTPVTPALAQWPRMAWARVVRMLGQPVLFLFTRIFVKLTVRGTENLEGLDTPGLFMPNHTSYLDSLIVAMALPARVRSKSSFAAARDVLYETFWYIAWFTDLFFNSFPLQRGESSNIRSGLENIGAMLDAGYSVIIFPEGQMSESGNLLPLKPGAGLIAIEMGTWVVPIRIEGAREVLPYAYIMPRKLRYPVTVTFGKPIKFNRLKENYSQAVEKIYSALELL